MKSLIKAKDGSQGVDVRAVDWAGATDVPVRTAPRPSPAANPALARLEQEIETLRTTLAAAETRHRQDLTAKVEQARKEAMAGYRRRDEEFLAALAQALAEASKDALERLGASERLALLLCDAALSTVFSDPHTQTELVGLALKRQVEQLRSEMILKARVSKADFPDAGSLQALVRTLGVQIDVQANSDIPPGACRLDLRLGHIDLSLPEHWSVLQAEFRRLAQAEARP